MIFSSDLFLATNKMHQAKMRPRIETLLAFRSRPSSRRRKKQPGNKLLSYSLSVVGERPRGAAAAASVEVAAAPPEGDWTLYRPQEPGNSPIYIAASSGRSTMRQRPKSR